jgi:DNA-binding NarL/FixJ family response regulator
VTLRAVVVDDEELPRQRVVDLVRAREDLELVGEAGDGAAALDLIAERRPDLVFLDIQLPELDGFQVIDALGDAPLPAVVFVTAYDEYAIRAFEVDAIDYLLKPVTPARFAAAVERARARLADPRRADASVPDPVRARARRARRGRARVGHALRRAPRHEALLHPRRRRRVDRRRGQLRPPPHGRALAPDPRHDEGGRGAARSGALRPHPPLGDRRRGPDRVDRGARAGGVSGDRRRRRPARLQPRVQRASAAAPALTAAGTAGSTSGIERRVGCRTAG